MHLTDMDLQQLLQKGGVHCDACGHAHHCDVEEVLLGSGVASRTALGKDTLSRTKRRWVR